MTSNQVTPNHPSQVSRRVLIVDDNLQVLKDLRMFLESTGELEIVGEATNGKEAVRLSQEMTPDVVVMDLEMPIMDGYQATRQIKSHIPAPRVVILSVYARPEEQKKAQLAGADEFVAKGASYEMLSTAILGKRDAQECMAL